jgi:hypothetical protein
MDIFSVYRILIIISVCSTEYMEEVAKCQCPPGSVTYEDEDGMLICISCQGWIE